MMTGTDRFNEVSRIAVPAAELWKNLILQRLWDATEAIESYEKLLYQQAIVDLYVVNARIRSLALMINPSMKRIMKTEHYQEFKEKLNSIHNITQAIEILEIVEDAIDKLGITRIEIKTSYDVTDPTIEDMVKGT